MTAFISCGSAAAQCGKTLPYRDPNKLYLRLRLEPRHSLKLFWWQVDGLGQSLTALGGKAANAGTVG